VGREPGEFAPVDESGECFLVAFGHGVPPLNRLRESCGGATGRATIRATVTQRTAQQSCNNHATSARPAKPKPEA
jgi:hypothetical protein